MIALKIIPLDGAPREEQFRSEHIRIGRSPENDLTIHDQSVSRLHAGIEHKGGSFIISDLGSRNGVVVNGVRIQGPMRIGPDDEIRLGDVTLRLVAPGPDVTLAEPFSGKVDTTVLAHEAAGKLSTTSFIPLDQITGEAEHPAAASLIQFLQEITEAVLAARPLEEVLEEIVRQLLKVLPEADRACLLLLEGDPPELKPRVARQRSGREARMTVSKTIVRRVVTTLDSVLSANAQEDGRFVGTESLVIQGTFSVMCAPLVLEGKAIGALYVDTLSPFKHFDREQLTLFATLGNIAAGHIQRHHLQQTVIEQMALKKQLDAAAGIQRRLLAAPPPERRGYSLYGTNRQCLDVGGDYFDFIDCGEGGIVFAIGDVSGKGLPAALLMVLVQATLRAEVRAGRDPLTIGRLVNNVIHSQTDPERFVTLFIGHLDPASGRLTYTSAGHDPALILRRGSDTCEELPSTGCPAGIMPNAPLESATVELGAGDLFFAYTDGIREAQAPDESEFGIERLGATLAAHRRLGPDDLAREIEAAVRTFLAGGEPQDDMTQLIVRREA